MKGMLISMGEKLILKSKSLLDQYIVDSFNCTLNLALITNEHLQERFTQKNTSNQNMANPKLKLLVKEVEKASVEELRKTERRMKDSCRRLDETYTYLLKSVQNRDKK